MEKVPQTCLRRHSIALLPGHDADCPTWIDRYGSPGPEMLSTVEQAYSTRLSRLNNAERLMLIPAESDCPDNPPDKGDLMIFLPVPA